MACTVPTTDCPKTSDKPDRIRRKSSKNMPQKIILACSATLNRWLELIARPKGVLPKAARPKGGLFR